MGLGFDLTAFTFQTPEFSKKYQVIAFDNRGIGRTDAPDMPYSTKMMADDTVGLMNALSIEKAHILGISMGGMIAQELALKYPQRVKSLILAAIAARVNFLTKHVSNTWSKMLQEGINQETIIRIQLPWLYTDKFFEDPKQVQTTINTMLANPYPQPAYAYARQAAACAEHDTRDRIGHITAPTLVLVGKEDILCPVKLSEELTAGIPNAELVVLEGGGHACTREIPDKFNRAVLEFLAKVEKGEKEE
jgi:pimeloyl-ACP methyl ester carboxylesterase